jgi:hypothetical protein
MEDKKLEKAPEEKFRENGVELQKKYSKIDLSYHFANCNISDPIELGKMSADENNMWANMLKDSYWAPIGGKLQEL